MNQTSTKEEVKELVNYILKDREVGHTYSVSVDSAKEANVLILALRELSNMGVVAASSTNGHFKFKVLVDFSIIKRAAIDNVIQNVSKKLNLDGYRYVLIGNRIVKVVIYRYFPISDDYKLFDGENYFMSGSLKIYNSEQEIIDELINNVIDHFCNED